MEIKAFSQSFNLLDRSPALSNARPTGESGTDYAKARSAGDQRTAPEGEIDKAGASRSGYSSTPSLGDQTTKEDMVEIAQLKKRDVEVRAHEQAHIAAGGQYIRSGPSYEFTVGPDGQQYAIGGEVSIDTSPVPGDPQRTIEKMQVVKRAALAPAQPSSQDRQVAAAAEGRSSEARLELMRRTLAKIQTVQGDGQSGTKGNSVDTKV